MHKRIAWLVVGCLGAFVCHGFFADGRDGVAAEPAAVKATAQSAAPPSPTLADLCSGKLEIVDLTYVLNDSSPYWPAKDYTPFRLTTIATLEKNGVLSKTFFTPEHLGTHLDAPNHFELDRPSVDQIKPQEFFAEGVVLDVTPQAAENADYLLKLEDVTRWEKEHGKIPDQAVILLRTGWGQHWKNFDRYKGQDTLGKLHFPGYSAEAAMFLVQERQARGLGIDTLSMDYGLSKDFLVHHIVNRATRYGLENLANLEKLPLRGFHLVVAPVKIETGSGGPARVFAILPKGSTK